MHGNQQAEQDQAEDCISAPEFELGQGVGGGQRDDDLENKDGRRHDDAVQEVAQQRGLLERRCVVEDHRSLRAVLAQRSRELGADGRRVEIRIGSRGLLDRRPARLVALDAELVDHRRLRAEEASLIALDLARRLQRRRQHHVERQRDDQGSEHEQGVFEAFRCGEAMDGHA
ncbi:hypothetical protein chiPu_0030959 [Chiloscyllium punctatum]|uniref:Uncharacterized protein n=1 Tax=Chiloscyllium punctatum TaxID=137246 RepID=A0A401TV96_CHIPU|nr:hypothetical protein [Chiloscyllium punctatum]